MCMNVCVCVCVCVCVSDLAGERGRVIGASGGLLRGVGVGGWGERGVGGRGVG